MKYLRLSGVWLTIIALVLISACSSTEVDRSEMVNIGGTEQYIQISGDDINNPLILFFHGGPGSSISSFAGQFLSGLEENFTVVHWDQRGAGKSYSPDIPPETMNIDQFVSDALEVIDYLLAEFNQEKLYLVGHSWGTILGMKVADRAPEKLYAYIGAGQAADMPKGEELSYAFVLSRAEKYGNFQALEELERIGPPPYEDLFHDTEIQRKWLANFGGAVHDPQSKLNGLDPFADDDTRTQFLKGQEFSLAAMLEEVMQVDLSTEITSLSVPLYICAGRYDFICPSELALDLYENTAAPAKDFIWFEQSAHNPLFEEPGKFQEVLLQILEDTR